VLGGIQVQRHGDSLSIQNSRATKGCVHIGHSFVSIVILPIDLAVSEYIGDILYYFHSMRRSRIT